MNRVVKMGRAIGSVAIHHLQVAVLFVPLFFFLGVTRAQATEPQWFPKSACRKVWKNKDLAKFDYSNDSKFSKLGNVGYDKYVKRLSQNGVDRSTCFKDWTILVYMAADTNLHPYAIWDLAEMEGRFESGTYAGSTLKTDLIVQVSSRAIRAGEPSGPVETRRLHIFERKDQAYLPATSKSQFESIGPEIIRSPIVDFRSGTQPSGADFKSFLEWGVKNYPAEKYMVVVWGHGQGWSSGIKEPAPRATVLDNPELQAALKLLNGIPQPPSSQHFGGIFNNPSTGSKVSVPDLRDAIRDVVENTMAGRPFDLYASDACLMQMTEVIAEISPYTRYVSGSAQVQSFLGLPYRRMLYEINTGRYLSTSTLTGREDEALLVARMLPILSEASLDPIRGQQGRADIKARETFTMSSVSSRAFEQSLVPALTKFSRSLSEYLAEDLARAFEMDAIVRATPSYMGGGRELGSFVRLVELSRNADVKRRGPTAGSKALGRDVASLEQAIDESVLERRLGTGYTAGGRSIHLLGFRGLGIWIPSGPMEYQHRSTDFGHSRLHQETQWQMWLKTAFGL